MHQTILHIQARFSCMRKDSEYLKNQTEILNNLTYFFRTTIIPFRTRIDFSFASRWVQCALLPNVGDNKKEREKERNSMRAEKCAPTWLMSGVDDRLKFRGQYFWEKYGAPRHAVERENAHSLDFPEFAFMIHQLAIFGRRKTKGIVPGW